MSKVLQEARLTTRNARAKLRAGMHWRAIAADVHLGYRRAVRGGRWLVRWYEGDGKYRQVTLGAADDALAADGKTTLNYSQAERAARKAVERGRAKAAAEAAGPLKTVRSAVASYLEAREAKDGEAGSARDARLRLTAHVLGDATFADTPLHALMAADLQGWLARLPASFARSTVRRLSNDFRAALNSAGANRDAVKDGLRPPRGRGARGRQAVGAGQVRDAQILPTADIVRLVRAALEVDAEGDWGGDLARLVIVLAATGARFSQVRRQHVGDVVPAQNRIMVPPSRKGNEDKDQTPIAFPVSADVIAALRPALAGRRPGDVLLLRPRWKQLTPIEWTKIGRAPWRFASELSRPWRAILGRAKLPAGVIPYSLRHSSIAAALKLNLPVRLVAAMHDTSAAMVERHYAKYINDALTDLAATAAAPIMPVGWAA
jgi:integrase